jgi:hypothetical protein
VTAIQRAILVCKEKRDNRTKVIEVLSWTEKQSTTVNSSRTDRLSANSRESPLGEKHDFCHAGLFWPQI